MSIEDLDRSDLADRAWCAEAIRKVEADANRSADTHLLLIDLPSEWGIELYLKDESTHPTGSLKHRLARSLFLYALSSGWLHEGTPVVEASSGSTAVSEAHFAKLLGLPFIAVMPASTSAHKIELIEREGGECHFVEHSSEVYAEAQRVADARGGHYLDQFTYAERATDWRGNNNIAESIFEQLACEPHPIPEWIVTGAGTGGTSATIGRYLRYRRHSTRLAVVDPEGSVFLRGWRENDPSATSETSGRIEGIGRPRMEHSFVPTVIDRMIGVPDAASIAGMRSVSDRIGRLVGPSTGTNIWGACHLIAEMLASGTTGSVVSLICDGGERYDTEHGRAGWIDDAEPDIAGYHAALDRFFGSGQWPSPSA